MMAEFANPIIRLQWGHGREAMDGRRVREGPRVCPGFNGATAVRPWMDGRPALVRDTDCVLQWGHGREAMDGGDGHRPDIGRYDRLQWGHGREAMDGCRLCTHLLDAPPLQWGHGREAMDGSRMPPPHAKSASFNGATAVRPWMGGKSLEGRARRPASMGPRP